MNRERKELLESAVLVAASIVLTLFIILGSGKMTDCYAAHWTDRTEREGDQL